MIMALTPHHCQQIATARRLAFEQLTGVAVLCLGCFGCWQEVRYEPDKSAVLAGAPSDEAPAVGAPVTGAPMPGDLVAEASSMQTDGSTSTAAVFPEEIAVDLPFSDESATGESANGASAKNESATGESATGDPELNLAPPIQGEPVREASVTEVTVLPTPNRTLRATWQMSSNWSMAAALHAKGRSSASFGQRLKSATDGAKLLGVTLPDLPTHDESADQISENLTFLLETAGPRLASELSKQHGADHAALAELATKTHVLLLSYTPSSTRLEPVINSIRQAAQQSGLPESVWRELVDLLTARAEFKQVKAAIFQLHQRAAAHLSVATN